MAPGKGMVYEDGFVNIWTQKVGDEVNPSTGAEGSHGSSFYEEWTRKASAKHSSPELFGADALRRLYPNHSLVMSDDQRLNVLNVPGINAVPLDETQLVTNLFFVPLANRVSPIPGVLVDSIEFGAFSLSWDKYEFILYIARWTAGFNKVSQLFLLHEGTEDPSRRLLLAAGIWKEELHNEIWVFNQGFWQKSSSLWNEVQKADWGDVILKDAFKRDLQKDVNGFFSSEAIYKELAIPWKRGLILYGPPGNGKTISVKAIMKGCDADGYKPLYVKSFQSWQGEEGAMETVFTKARQLAPCVVVLEDLDSLINNQNRSFFLNQIDGLVGNDGLLVIATTNHFERLDPGLSSRPSRFDRKYLFDVPDREERALYAKYWQGKLKGNSSIDYPDSLVGEVADTTNRFSFAYLKEAFVSTLVTLADSEGADKPSFTTILRRQIKTLRGQLGNDVKTTIHTPELASSRDVGSILPSQSLSNSPTLHGIGAKRDIRGLLDALSDAIDKSERYPHSTWELNSSAPPFGDVESNTQKFGYSQLQHEGRRDIRGLLDALSDAIDRSEVYPRPTYEFNIPNSSVPLSNDGRDYRMLFDQISGMPQRNDGTARTFTTQVTAVPSRSERGSHSGVGGPRGNQPTVFAWN